MTTRAMQHYDLLYIVSTAIPEGELIKINEQIKEKIKSLQGTITKETAMGKKKLAYKIKQQKYGIYTNIYFDLDPKNLFAISNQLRLDNNILRYLIIKGQPKAEPVFTAIPAIAKETMARPREDQEAKTQPANTIETKEESKSISDTSVPDHKEINKPQEIKREKETKKDIKVSLEELDEKLDKILNDDIIK